MEERGVGSAQGGVGDARQQFPVQRSTPVYMEIVVKWVVCFGELLILLCNGICFVQRNTPVQRMRTGRLCCATEHRSAVQRKHDIVSVAQQACSVAQQACSVAVAQTTNSRNTNMTRRGPIREDPLRRAVLTMIFIRYCPGIAEFHERRETRI